MNMTANKEVESGLQLTVDTVGLQKILCCGRPMAVQIGENAKARVSVGRRVLWNVKKIQEYIGSISEGGGEDEAVLQDD